MKSLRLVVVKGWTPEGGHLPAGFLAWEDAVGQGLDAEPGDLAALMYTSGSLGRPKVPLFQRDPAAFKRPADAGPEGEAALGTKLIVDATIKTDCMEVSLPSGS